MTTPTKEQIDELYKQAAGSCACDDAFDICYLTPMQYILWTNKFGGLGLWQS